MKRILCIVVCALYAFTVAGCAKDEPAQVGDINAPEQSEQAASSSVETASSNVETKTSSSSETLDAVVRDEPVAAVEHIPEITDAICAITEIEDYTPEAYDEWVETLTKYGVSIANDDDVKKPFLIATNTSGDFAFGAVLTDSSYARSVDDDRVYTITMRVLRATSATSGKSTKTITHNITTLLPSETDDKYIDEARWTLTLTDNGSEGSLKLDTPDWCD